MSGPVLPVLVIALVGAGVACGLINWSLWVLTGHGSERNGTAWLLL